MRPRIHWNREGFKIGLCSAPPVRVGGGRPAQGPSVLALSNNCCIATTLSSLESRFQKLYSRRAMLHHYTQFVDVDAFESAREDLAQLIDDYRGLDQPQPRIPGGLEAMPLRSPPLF